MLEVLAIPSKSLVESSGFCVVTWSLGVLDCGPAKRTRHKDIQISSCVAMSTETSPLAFL